MSWACRSNVTTDLVFPPALVADTAARRVAAVTRARRRPFRRHREIPLCGKLRFDAAQVGHLPHGPRCAASRYSGVGIHCARQRLMHPQQSPSPLLHPTAHCSLQRRQRRHAGKTSQFAERFQGTRSPRSSARSRGSRINSSSVRRCTYSSRRHTTNWSAAKGLER